MIATVKSTEEASSRGLQIMNVLFLCIWICFFRMAKDPADWWIENILVILFFGWMFIKRKKLVLSNSAYLCMIIFLTLHIYGAQAAYTHNELGEFLRTRLHLWRNPYDRIVHFSFGFLILYPFYELISQRFSGKRNFSLLISNMAILCLATIFELIEWGVAACTDKATGETYVATQGDPWDAQKDIFVAIVGSILFTLIFNGLNNRKTVVSSQKLK